MKEKKRGSNGAVSVGLIQMSMADDPVLNLKKAVQSIEKAAQKGAKIICLPELFRSLYFCQTHDQKHFALAESIPGPTTVLLSNLAKRKSVVIIAPLFEKRAEGIYHNSAVVIDADGKILGKYRKMHIPDDPHFYEKYYFSPGDLGFQVFDTRYGKIAVLICWDQWFPEAARLAALNGAQILFYPTAIGWHDSDKALVKAQQTGWEVVQRGHAVANELFVAVVNRTGREGKLNFWGRSFIADPFGSMIAQASENKEQILMAECDLTQIEETRQNWPFLRDRRLDAYQALTSRFLDES